MKLCTTCRFYQQGNTEATDFCTHLSAEYGGVREVKQYDCRSMRAGICGKDAKLFEQNTDAGRSQA